MPTLISNSGSDERGRYSGGAAGDQTGREWRVIDWYSRPWSCVLRHPDAGVREKLAWLAERAAGNDKIGYDQSQRTTYWDQLAKAGYDPARITTACEADCSAGVCANVRAAGHLLGIAALKGVPITSTHYMRGVLEGAGFQVLTASRYLGSGDYLLRGDILLNDAVHTATVVSDGAKAGASSAVSTSPASGASKRTASQLADEIIAGKWGSGQARIDSLRAAGYTTAEIAAAQSEVNARYGKRVTTTTATATTSTRYRVTARAGLNVRRGAGTSYGVVRALAHGSTVTVTKTQGGWGYIGDGWVSMAYLARA